jgi:hypothetical protein
MAVSVDEAGSEKLALCFDDLVSVSRKTGSNRVDSARENPNVRLVSGRSDTIDNGRIPDQKIEPH